MCVIFALITIHAFETTQVYQLYERYNAGTGPNAEQTANVGYKVFPRLGVHFDHDQNRFFRRVHDQKIGPVFGRDFAQSRRHSGGRRFHTVAPLFASRRAVR